MTPVTTVGNDSRHDGGPRCPIGNHRFPPSGRRRSCSDACRRQAFRLRHREPTDELLANLTRQLRAFTTMVDETVDECPRVANATRVVAAARTTASEAASSDPASSGMARSP